MRSSRRRGGTLSPNWYGNLIANPNEVCIQDGAEVFDVTVRELEGEERDDWWKRGAAAYPPYTEYPANTERRIPVLLRDPQS